MAATRLSTASAMRAYGFTLGNQSFHAAHFHEKLAPMPGTEALNLWPDRFLAGTPVATRRAHGKGQVIYLGTYLTEGLAQHLLQTTLAAVEPQRPGLPEGIEITVREGRGREGRGRRPWFLRDTTAKLIWLRLPAGTALLGDARPEGEGHQLLAPFFTIFIWNCGRSLAIPDENTHVLRSQPSGPPKPAKG